jgi:uncharacterized protein YkwD
MTKITVSPLASVAALAAIALAGTLLLAGPALAAPAPAAAPPPSLPREALIQALNAEREKAGVPPLTPMPELDRVAQARAEELAKQSSLPGEVTPSLFARIDRQIAAAGYQPHGWAESFAVTPGDAAAVVDYWKSNDPEPFRDALRADFQHLGVGVARHGSVPLYTFLVAWPETEYYRRQVAVLADLPAVRKEMIERVNQARKSAGVPPLAVEPRLQQAAQAYAEEMLRRSFYAHKSPEGQVPRDRATLAGYDARIVAENIAAGSLTVETVLGAWLLSSGHRRNLLDPALTDFGLGLAVGPIDHRYRVLWVQLFGRPKPPDPTTPLLPRRPLPGS